MKSDATIIRRVFPAMEGIMRGRRSAPQGLSTVLQVLSAVYGSVVRRRARRYRLGGLATQRLPCIVVSVGNLSVGGTGKTPMAIYLARLIRGIGCRTAVLSRGYKGSAENRGGLVSDGRRILMGPGEAGDEPHLMARRLLPMGIPVVVGRNRLQSGRLAVDLFQCEVIVLDDGFQHLQLERDLDLVLLDADQPFGNGYLLPRGTLREPIEALARADACLLTRCPLPALSASSAPRSGVIAQMAGRQVRPVFPAAHGLFVAERLMAGGEPGNSVALPARVLTGEAVFAFSGLARNREFRAGLQALGLTLRGWMSFSDHHSYTPADLETVTTRARARGAGVLATTAKDRVKIDPAWIGGLELLVLDVRMELGAYADAFERFVLRRLGLE